MSDRYHTPHFDHWLEPFAETAHEVCPPAAARFLECAHRIADSIELGAAAQKREVRLATNAAARPRRDPTG